MMERGIPFSGPMVRAILAGKKTQTRRIINPRDLAWWNATGCQLWHDGYPLVEDDNGDFISLPCPYGGESDLLYVREHWRTGPHLDCLSGSGIAKAAMAAGYSPECPLMYDSDHEERSWGDDDEGDFGCNWGRLRMARFMPKWAARIWLEITEVRAERVNQISEEDAKAEGADPNRYADLRPDGELREGPSVAYRAGFHELWDSINAARGYAFNDGPWVWVISFRQIEKPAEKAA